MPNVRYRLPRQNQRRLKRDTVVMPDSTYGIYMLDNATLLPGSSSNVRDGNLDGIGEYDWITGYAARRQWSWLHTGQDTYDFSSIDRLFEQMDKENPRLYCSLLMAAITDDGVDTGEPQYIYDAASAGDRWASPGGNKCLPWYTGLQTGWSEFINALANHEVYDICVGEKVALKNHSKLAKINIAVCGYGPLREPGSNQVEDIPNYTRALFKQAAIDCFQATLDAFPNKRVSSTLNQMDDNAVGETYELSEDLRRTFKDLWGDRFQLFHDALSCSRDAPGGVFTGRPSTGFTPELRLAYEERYTEVLFQAARAWTSPHVNVENSTPLEGMDYGWSEFGCRYYELYQGDIHETDWHDGYRIFAERFRRGPKE